MYEYAPLGTQHVREMCAPGVWRGYMDQLDHLVGSGHLFITKNVISTHWFEKDLAVLFGGVSVILVGEM